MTSHTLKRSLLTLLIPLAIISLAIQPLLTGHMPWQGDGLLHYVRLAVLENAVRAGDFYPRWSPDLAYGYGFPLFNYYAPLSYYIGLPFRLAGMSLKAATNTSYILAMWVLAAGAYGWGKDAWNRAAGAAAALLLCYNPYILNNLLHRSALAELWGLAWLMATLWGIQRLFDVRRANGRLTTFILTTFCYTALMLSHNITAMIGTPFIVGYALYLAFTIDPITADTDAPPPFFRADRSAYALLFIPFALALSAFFWLPAFVEKDLVQVERLVDGANFAYENHFQEFGMLYDRNLNELPTNTAWLNPPLRQGVGFSQIMYFVLPLFLISLFTVSSRRRKELAPYAYLLKYFFIYMVAWIIPTLLTHRVSSFLWDNLALLSFVQFPWRFTGLSAISFVIYIISIFRLSMIASETARKKQIAPPKQTRQDKRNFYILMGMNIFTVFFMGRFLIERSNIYFWPAPLSPLSLLEGQNTADLTTFELETGWLGTTAAGDYLPDTVLSLPLPQDRPTNSVTQSEIVLTEAQTVTFDQFYFPSWQVSNKGISLPLSASEPYGFLQVDLPAGSHQLTFEQVNTPIQRTGNIVSLISGIAIVVLISLQVARRSQGVHFGSVRTLEDEPPFVWKSWAFGALAISILLPFSAAVLKTAVFDRGDSSLHIHNPQLPPSAYFSFSLHGEMPRTINFENQLVLLDDDLIHFDDDDPLQPRGLRLFWRAPNAMQDYSISLHVQDYYGYVYGQSDNLHPGNIPVTKWTENVFVSDDHWPLVKLGTPPGWYDIELIVYDANGRRLNVFNGDGQPIGNSHDLGTFRVEAVSSPEDVKTGIDNLLPVPACTAIACLTGYNIPPVAQAAVGDLLPITFFLERPEGQRALPYSLPLTLVSSDGSQQAKVSAQVFEPDGIDVMADHIRRFEQAFHLPTTLNNGDPLPTGEYTLYFSDQPLHTLNITTPERDFIYEPLPFSHNTLFADLALLDSTDLNQDLTALDPAQPLTASFLWHPQTSTDQSYKVFVQLLNSEQRVVAQSDRLPHNGDEPRPTTSWVANEYILDTHQLTLPADLDPTAEYTLIVGLYNEATGKRLSALASDFVPIRP